ncbi:four helix bundle protein [Oceanihabitans sediminis]|uniref:Four helix bundle protein n=1 Tax=Oceanihabitans sediminis TaxID=1812012 RepID=A0A368P7R4_9FLAO|nr:four helix bundle protein [Oceanihabitans sediminis]MDX1772498.1 four helix bundle protein [Oceanihabitans sediminis]RBP34147.1 four helix bundle protein [Oceanihabitans sediminis]RCU57839.1 four helix bundle protein [Oceanihabitans sediminis]
MKFESNYHFSFENLIVYQKAIAFGEIINELVETFPHKETFRLTSQFSRAADSIAANISEGSASTDANFNRYLKMAWDSSHECVTWNTKAYLRKYISKEQYESNRALLTEKGKMISSLRRKLNIKN